MGTNVCKGCTQENVEQKQILKKGGEKMLCLIEEKLGRKKWWGGIYFQTISSHLPFK